MDSVYKNMQPCPNQMDQMYYSPYYYPGVEAIPPQMHMSSPRPPVGYGWWPWGGNYGGAPPSACHGCCNHSYLPPHCGWGSPYANVPQHHCPGNYPSLPVQYMAPPPFYAMGQPRFEYEKNNVPREHHCCGCPNHPFHDKEHKSVRIEEEEPERERRGFDSLVPYRPRNSPDPVVWIPHDHGDKKEQGKVNNTGDRSDAKAQHPAFWNGWHPLDLNSLASMKNRGDGEENNQHGDGNRSLPFPLFWIPYKSEEKNGEKHKIRDGNVEPSLELEKGSGGEQSVHQNRENTGDQAAVKLRDIPVKEVAQHVGKETSKIQEKESNGGEKKVEKGTSRKSPSPPKSSKLPPVCLRVDPLPRRKNGNGSSQPNDVRKVVKSSETKEQAKSLHNELNKDESAKTIKVVDGRTSNADNTDVNVDVLTNQTEEKPREGRISQNHAENDVVVESQSEGVGSTRSKNEGIEEKKLSEEEAAVIIQSAYRGFDVRKWEIIKKLKQIAKVREQMADVERRIQAMKSSSDVQSRSKQRNVIAETIMSLLLKLDTIQGVHPSIRAVRKSAVKELVSLQEQLDLLMNEQPENSPDQESILTHDDDALKKSEAVSSQNGNETIDGGSNHERSEADLIRETATERQEKEAAESFCNSGVESAPTAEEDEKSNEVFENERAIPAEDNKDLLLGMASELSSLEKDDSAKVTPVPTIGQDKESNGVGSASAPTVEDDEKSNEVCENDETIPVEDNKDLLLGMASELSSLEKDNSAKVTPVPTIGQDEESNGVGSASAPTVEDDEKSNEVFENEKAIPKEDNEDLLLGTASELSSLEKDDSAKVTSVPTIGQDEKSNGVESASASASTSTVEEDEKSNEALENERAISKEDNEDLILGKASELSSLEMDDSAKAAPIPTIEQDKSDHLDRGSKLLSQQKDDSAKATDESPELPIDVIDAFSAEEGFNDDEAVEEDASKADQAKQPEEASIESSESHETAEDRDGNQTGETEEVSDLPFNRVESDTQETCPTKGPVNNELSDVIIEPDECVTKQPTEPSEASEEIEYCTCSKGSTELTSQSVVTGINDTEVSSKQDQPEAIKGGENTEPSESSRQDQPNAIEEGDNTSQGSNEEKVADQTLEKNSQARDDVTERNRILIEENERLRDMMERLIKSGQEQLTAISSLSGRVKDLEKKLSRKKKLKLKQHRNPKSDLHA